MQPCLLLVSRTGGRDVQFIASSVVVRTWRRALTCIKEGRGAAR